MTDLYIPPEGAMQFHVTRDTYRNRDVDFVVWVEKDALLEPPGVVRGNPCRCQFCWVVIQETIPLNGLRSGAKRDHHRRTVCTCMGKLIE